MAPRCSSRTAHYVGWPMLQGMWGSPAAGRRLPEVFPAALSGNISNDIFADSAATRAREAVTPARRRLLARFLPSAS
jgi:hypothetical protein